MTNHLKNNKGQLAPVFLALISILLIMAFVTINLGKVALVKTQSSNGADAGALAAGSTMANLYNFIVHKNVNILNKTLLDSLGNLTIHKDNMLKNLAFAEKSAAESLTSVYTVNHYYRANPCTACTQLKSAMDMTVGHTANIDSAWSAINSAIGDGWGMFLDDILLGWINNYNNYLWLRKIAMKGRQNAIKVGHKYNLLNSGIYPRLIKGPPPSAAPNKQNRNFAAMFSDYIDKLTGLQAALPYDWVDAQGIEHRVDSVVDTGKPYIFRLQVSRMPVLRPQWPTPPPADTTYLFDFVVNLFPPTLWDCYQVSNALKIMTKPSKPEEQPVALEKPVNAYYEYKKAVGDLQLACDCQSNKAFLKTWWCQCVKTKTGFTCTVQRALWDRISGYLSSGLTLHKYAVDKLKSQSIHKTVTKIWHDISAGWICQDITSFPGNQSGLYLSPFFIWMILDVDQPSPSEVKVTTTETHGKGLDWGLWRSEYPNTISWSKVSFQGRGSFPAIDDYDASIIDTDK